MIAKQGLSTYSIIITAYVDWGQTDVVETESWVCLYGLLCTFTIPITEHEIFIISVIYVCILLILFMCACTRDMFCIYF